jgi:hypothetical protein
VKLIVATKRINECDAEAITQQCNDFLDNIPLMGSNIFTGFNPYGDRLGEFVVLHMSAARYGALLEIVKLLLTLSHGQTTVERGFSVNKVLEFTQMKETSVVPQRIIGDHV